MPWRMTPDHLATLMRSMSGRPYGWGNDNFNNDCSAELRSLLMPFGVFLPGEFRRADRGGKPSGRSQSGEHG